MGGRTMPQECEHGVVLSWGDFGPEGGGRPPPCPKCDEQRAERQRQRVRDFVDWLQRTYPEVPYPEIAGPRIIAYLDSGS